MGPGLPAVAHLATISEPEYAFAQESAIYNLKTNGEQLSLHLCALVLKVSFASCHDPGRFLTWRDAAKHFLPSCPRSIIEKSSPTHHLCRSPLRRSQATQGTTGPRMVRAFWWCTSASFLHPNRWG